MITPINTIEKYFNASEQTSDTLDKIVIPFRHFLIGEHCIRLQFQNNKLEKYICPALEHLETDNILLIPDLTIYINEGLSIADPFWSNDYIDPLSGDIKNIPDRYYFNQNTTSQTISAIDFQLKKAIYSINSIDNLPLWDRGFPMRILLYTWFQKHDYIFIHAAGIGKNNAGVLLTGKGGSGKSTAALSCLSSNLQYAGDDYVMVDVKTCDAYSLYNTGKLEKVHARSFPHLYAFIKKSYNTNDEKSVLYVNEYNPAKIITKFNIKAILLPTHKGKRETIVCNTSKASAMKALAPSTIWLLRTDKKMVTQIAELIRKLPCYDLETGTELEQIPLKIETMLEELCLSYSSRKKRDENRKPKTLA